ncbi:family 10 glycosylhydrolase [Paenibacillus agricola]|uniref:Family 10 glycosylhydrolase n=1 Tax=Paenibacillus agricola TaxID=2716264 RepID=A0ABX0JH14_9BACL|nr:family 10 glycosylhydrolase [Paenibacillus agricola]NHN34197.1 family 10 glycosylhydrolase [Paenibacillus agricola]
MASWWSGNKLRLVQNNLRETDANLDVDLLIGDLEKLAANVLMMNAGGIVAFYPTKLEYHYRAEGQQKDLLKEAIDKAHAAGLKFIARFDFSKAHESIYNKQPDWFYRTKEGKEVNYHGIVHTCINGYYQREYSLKLISEVISQYEVDGIFFNMFGYQTHDYSGYDYGICFCDSCKSRFREWSGGLELPLSESLEDPVYRKYKEFQDATTKEMLDRIHDLVKSSNKDIAISTYNEHKVDIVRKESNTDNRRPHPVWLYSASENVKSLEDAWEDKLISNCCINAIDLVHRFTAVSKHEMNIRLKESLASGSGLDFCIIGVFEDYPDRENLPTVANIFQYHKEHEQYYGNFLSVADVALIKPGGAARKSLKEYSGIFKMLKEQHILFDVIHQNNLKIMQQRHSLEKVGRYRIVIVPDIAEFSAEDLLLLEALFNEGVQLLSTGRSFTEGEANVSFLQRVFDVLPKEVQIYERDAAYLQTSDKTLFKHFLERDWIFLKGAFQQLEFGPSTTKQLPFITPSTFGPPERASGHGISGESFGAAIRSNGLYSSDRSGIGSLNSVGVREADGSSAHSRGAVYLPWQAGELYYKYGYADHKHVVLDILDDMASARLKLTTNAPQNVEVFFNRLDAHTYILHLLNLSGFNGTTYFEPVPIYDLEISLHDIGDCKLLDILTPSVIANFTTINGNTAIQLPELKDFAAIVIKVKASI